MGFTSNRIVASDQARGSWPMEQLLLDRHAIVTGAGVPVTNRSVVGLPAFDAAVRFAANAVAQLTAKVWRGDGPIRDVVTTTWQARLFRGSPSDEQDSFLFWYILEASLTARRNAFYWKTRAAGGGVSKLTALHPDQVMDARRQGRHRRFSVQFSDGYPLPPDVAGYGSITVDETVIRHIRGPGGIGEVLAPSPIREFRTSFGVALAKQQHEASVYRNGAQGGMVVSFPAGVSKDQADKWRDGFDSEHAGVYNTSKTKVVGNGAEVKQIGMSQKDAQFVEAVGLSIADMSLVTGVPEWLLGQQAATSKPLSPEHEMQRWMYTGLGPRLSRIESAVNADPDLFGGGTDYFAFDTADVIRGDLNTEADIAIRKVQAGIWLPDEARAKDSLGPHAGGVGKIVQITPVGGAPNASAPKTATE